MEQKPFFQELLAQCDALDQLAVEDTIHRHTQHLREGLQTLHQQMLELESEKETLRGQRESLETQVMDMAHEQTLPPNWWEKVTFVFSDDPDEPETFPTR